MSHHSHAIRHNLLALFLLTTYCVPFSTAEEQAKPNILFIAIDDLNNYALGLNDAASAVTPHLQQLASRGTLFTNAHCAAPACNPSRVSVLSGMAPYHSGVYLNSQDWRENKVLQSTVTLPQHFRDHGYKVMGGGKLYHAANLRDSMLEGYFDPRPWHEYFPSKTRQLADEVAPSNQAVNGSNDFYGGRFDWNALEITDDEMGDGKVVAWAEAQLAKQHDQPLFLSVGIYRPHIPWYTPKPWFELNAKPGIQLPLDAANDLDDIPNAGINSARQLWHQWIVDNDKWADATQAYLASVSFADAMVGRLIKALDSGPMSNNTIIVLWSDHGYHLGHKRHWEKFTLWKQATHVPMIVVDRNRSDQRNRCDQPVSLLDIYPTLTELSGTKCPDHVDGQSLVPHLRDASNSRDRSIIITHGQDNYAIQSQSLRFIRYYDGSEELYDHRSDPGELRNLATDTRYAAERTELASRLPKSSVKADPPIKPSANRFVVSLPKEKLLAVYSISNHNLLREESRQPVNAEPGATIFDRAGKSLYVATKNPNSIRVFDTSGTTLRHAQTVAVPDRPSFLEMTPDGSHLLAAYYKTGQLTVHRVRKTGLLSEVPMQTVDSNENPHSVAIHSTGNFAYVPHTKPNSISQFSFDSVTGQLQALKPSSIERPPNTGPRHLRFHPTADVAYASNEQGCSISFYSVSPSTGTLLHRQTIPSLPSNFDGPANASDVKIHPNGRFAYVANRLHGSVSVFSIDQTTYELTWIHNIQTEAIPRSFDIAPSGNFLAVGGQRSGNLVIYRIAEDGKLTKATHWSAGKSIWWVTFFPPSET